MDTKEKIKSESKEKLEDIYSIILYNDDVNSFDHVINCLIKYCKHSPEKAEQCSLVVHFNGKCNVKSGSFEELENVLLSLIDSGLSAKIEN